MDIRKSLCNFEEIIDDNISLPLDEEDKINEIEYLPRTLVLNYPDTDNSTINSMNNYFQNESFTYTNEYTVSQCQSGKNGRQHKYYTSGGGTDRGTDRTDRWICLEEKEKR